MANDELSKQQVDGILNALDEAINQGPWDASSLLTVIGKKLRDLREEFANQVTALDQPDPKTTLNLAHRMALRKGQQEVFVSLYSSDGANLQVWERIVMNLPNQNISRPIYINEKDLKDLIRSTDKQINKAYVSIYVDQNDLITMVADKIPLDKLGHPLLSLKDRALRLDNINYFVHLSARYHYQHGRLIKDL